MYMFRLSITLYRVTMSLFHICCYLFNAVIMAHHRTECWKCNSALNTVWMYKILPQPAFIPPNLNSQPTHKSINIVRRKNPNIM